MLELRLEEELRLQRLDGQEDEEEEEESEYSDSSDEGPEDAERVLLHKPVSKLYSRLGRPVARPFSQFLREARVSPSVCISLCLCGNSGLRAESQASDGAGERGGEESARGRRAPASAESAAAQN